MDIGEVHKEKEKITYEEYLERLEYY